MDRLQDTILNSLAHCLFGKKVNSINNVDIIALMKEANTQAVFPYVFSAVRDDIRSSISPEKLAEYDNHLMMAALNTIRVNAEHGELHEIMTKAEIPYVVMKGCASAAYYPDPDLRSMGDVDFLVHLEDIPRGIKALEANGFERDQYEFTTNQSAYHRAPNSIWEIHKEPSGIPKSDVGELIRESFKNIFDEATLHEHDGAQYYVPSVYHHGLILILHKISHMTTTGIGLRHLCDWAVFESSLSNEEFIDLFERKFKAFGIWRFAQIITQVCEKYLGAPHREWAQDSDISPQLLEDIIDDVFAGGNFGHKDANRQREIKYLTDREQGTLGNKGLVSQAISSLNSKVYTNHPLIKKHKLLLPAGWIVEGGAYFGALLRGKRKNKDNVKMLKEASKRKTLYTKMRLFE